MELILKEWLGAGGEYFSLFDDSIIQLNISHFLQKPEDEQKKHFSEIRGINGKRNIQDIDLKEYRLALKMNFTTKLREIVSDNKKKVKIISEIDKINKNHKAKFKNKNINPICEIVEIKGELYVWTYQFAAEFEINLDEKKKEVLKIKIEPRNLISEDNFKKMFETIFNFHQLENISGGKTSSFLLLYYLAFLGRMSEVLNRGIYREYVELEENLPFLKERLLFSDHIRLNHFDKSKLYCGFSELSPDNFINQTINTTLNHIQKHFKDYPSFQYEAKKIKSVFFQEEVSNSQININAIKNIRYNRQNKRYEEIMDYCENILKNIGGSFSSENKMNYSAFYIDMNELFETYIGKKLIETRTTEIIEDCLMKNFSEIWKVIDQEQNNRFNYSVEFQNKRHYTLDEENVFTIKPDFLIKDAEDKVIAVIDTKYKRLNDNEKNNFGISSNDVYQVLSYAYKFNTNNILLIYPKPTNTNIENRSYSIKIDGLEGAGKTLNICFVDLISN